MSLAKVEMTVDLPVISWMEKFETGKKPGIEEVTTTGGTRQMRPRNRYKILLLLDLSFDTLGRSCFYIILLPSVGYCQLSNHELMI